jgi:hypothetical protein
MKIFYDAPSQQFIITWHASEKQYPSGEGGRNHWKSMRTFYILTKDFETFTPATKLFNFSGKEVDMAQIDASIHYYGGKYYAVIKDERWTTASGDGYVYGKTVRIAVSDRLTGPYANPGPPVTPAWREAPTMVTSPGGNWYYMYVEDYTQHVYMLYRSQTLTSNTEWEQVTDFVPPPGDNCRHGCVVPVDGVTWQKLMQAYDISVDDVPVPGKTAESTEDLPQYDYSW